MNGNTAGVYGDGNSGSQIGWNNGPVVNIFHAASQVNDSNLQQHPHIISRRSLEPVRHFVDREAISSQIRDQLRPHETSQPVRRRIVVLDGLGGAGKSQMALQYAFNHQSEYLILFWILAESQQSIENDFITLYRIIHGNSNIRNDELPKIEDLIVFVKDWIFRQPGRHLLVFDGADNLAGRAGEPSLNICDYMPDGGQTDVIITTRHKPAQRLATGNPINVGTMTNTESVELFCKNAELKTYSEDTDVEAIVEKLGHLPLAVTLAGSYVSRCPRLWSNPKGYLEEYEKERSRLLKLTPFTSVDQYSQSILTAWEVSVKAIQSHSDGAARLLGLLAFLSFENFSPDDFFPDSTEAESVHPELCSNRMRWQCLISCDIDLHMRDIEDMFRLLEDHSLIHRVQRPNCSLDTSSLSPAERDGYQMHKLVHTWSYERLSNDERLGYGVAALQLLNVHILGSDADLTARLRLMDHVTTCLENFVSLDRAEHLCMYEIVRYAAGFTSLLATMSNFPAAIKAATFWFSEAASLFGRDDHLTMSAQYYLTLIMGWQGRKYTWQDLSEDLSEDLLVRQERLSGGNHPDTLKIMLQRCEILDRLDQSTEALSMRGEIIQRMQSDPEHDPELMLRAKRGIAKSLRDAGDLVEAERIQREVLHSIQSQHVVEHGLTLQAMSDLASILEPQCLFQEASLLRSTVVSGYKRLYGENDGRTLEARLDEALGMHGCGEEATRIVRIREVFGDVSRLLGPRHLLTLSAMVDEAYELIRLGEHHTALTLQENICTLCKATFGSENVFYLKSLLSYAGSLAYLGNFMEARTALRLAWGIQILNEIKPMYYLARRLQKVLDQHFGDQGTLESASRG